MTQSNAPGILHVDMDAFYASVETRDNPALAGRPVIVGGAPERRGVVAAASYAARRYGVRSAMPMARALRLCPAAVRIQPRMARYVRISAEIHAIFARYTPLIEPIALDEAFLDVTAVARLHGTGEAIGRRIKKTLRGEIGLVASVGVAPNKFLAKLASAIDKPDGLRVVRPGEIRDFLDPLPVERLWGVGRVTGARLTREGIGTVGDLRARSRAWMKVRFGARGEQFWRLVHGRDDRPVTADREARSVSQETTFAEDIDEPATLRGCALAFTERVGQRLRAAGLRAGEMQLKLRDARFHTLIRSRGLAAPSNDTRSPRAAVMTLFDEWLAHQPRPLRLLGVGAGRLSAASGEQILLFDEERNERGRKVDAVVDAIASRFGVGAIHRGCRR